MCAGIRPQALRASVVGREFAPGQGRRGAALGR